MISKMDWLRNLIIKRVKTNGSVNGSWVLDVYCHLLSHGASPDDAIRAMDLFGDEIIAMKARQLERVK